MQTTEETIYNERQVGNFLKTIPRDSFTVATKFNPALNPGVDEPTVVKSFEASLANLQLDYVDLYYLHRCPGTVEELETWMRSAKV